MGFKSRCSLKLSCSSKSLVGRTTVINGTLGRVISSSLGGKEALRRTALATKMTSVVILTSGVALGPSVIGNIAAGSVTVMTIMWTVVPGVRELNA